VSPRYLNPDKLATIRKLAEQGCTPKQVAVQTGYSTAWLYVLCRREGIKFRPRCSLSLQGNPNVRPGPATLWGAYPYLSTKKKT